MNRHHPKRLETVGRIMEKYTPEPNSGCWLWDGAVTLGGYALIQDSFDQKTRYAHRLIFEHFFGEIPQGVEVDHICRCPSCIRPDHLRAATRAENNAYSRSPTALNMRKTHCKRGHKFTVENTIIKKTKSGFGRACRECERKELWKQT